MALLTASLPRLAAPEDPGGAQSATLAVHLKGVGPGVEFDIEIGAGGALSCTYRYTDPHPLFRGVVSATGQVEEGALKGFKRDALRRAPEAWPAELGSDPARGAAIDETLELTLGGVTRRVHRRSAAAATDSAPPDAASPEARYLALRQDILDLCPATPGPAYLDAS